MKVSLRSIAAFAITCIMVTQANAADQFVSFDRTDATQLELTSKQDTIVYDRNEWEGVKIAVRNLRNDLKAVSGSSNAPIVVATVGKSALAKRWSKQCKQLKGKWEQYLIFTDKGQLVILGSDKRGTIYGIYELSRQIGVSPWYWMADAPIAKHENIYNQRWLTTEINAAAGKHTLRIIMIDPEVVLEQVVINPDNTRYSYFGDGVEL